MIRCKFTTRARIVSEAMDHKLGFAEGGNVLLRYVDVYAQFAA
jgi:hypothetical protein